MAASSLASPLLRSLRWLVPPQPAHSMLLFYRPPAPSHANPLPSLTLLPCIRRSVSSRALRSPDSISVADDVPELRKKEKASTTWDEASEVFFAPRERKDGGDAAGAPKDMPPRRSWLESKEGREPAGSGKESSGRNAREQRKGASVSRPQSNMGVQRVPHSRGAERGFKARRKVDGLEKQSLPDLEDDEEEKFPGKRPLNTKWRDRRDTGRQEKEENTKKRDWREPSSAGTTLPRVKGEVIYGVNPIYAALQISRREFFCLYVQENMPMDGSGLSKRKDKKAFEWVLKSAISRDVEVKEISKHDLNMLADNRPHQGLVLDASPLELVLSNELEEPLEGSDKKAPVWVALDEVTDPQNFGAILRSAYFLGAAGVVVCAKNSAPLSGVVSKASAGALEVTEILSCRNMVKFLDRSTEKGWRVVGAAAAGRGAVSVRELARGIPTILVLGGEGKGLRTNVRRACDELVCIPGIASKIESKIQLGERLENDSDRDGNDEDIDNEDDAYLSDPKGEDFVAVESLNVSVAAGILLHELVNGEGASERSLF